MAQIERAFFKRSNLTSHSGNDDSHFLNSNYIFLLPLCIYFFCSYMLLLTKKGVYLCLFRYTRVSTNSNLLNEFLTYILDMNFFVLLIRRKKEKTTEFVKGNFFLVDVSRVCSDDNNNISFLQYTLHTS